MNRFVMSLLILFVVIPIFGVESRMMVESPSKVREFIQGSNNNDESVGTRWAVLIAGSNGYANYRHQADVCHAYQILKKGGLKDENIVVFMYDDIAFNDHNPRPGVIINSPHGPDVYEGVPKDYIGDDVNVDNFFAVLLGNETGLTGGSGKVVDSGPNDHIFVYYVDHGGPGVLGMPNDGSLYANDLNDVLKTKHDLGTYKSLVFYIEACESGSIFEGLLPKGLNIYATTASNANESSYGYYCPGFYPSPPPEYDTCLGDLYSVAWLEDSDLHDLRTETLKQQYQLVKRRTLTESYMYPGSQVMQFGDIELSMKNIFVYMGTNPENDNYNTAEVNSSPPSSSHVNQSLDADVKSLLPSSFKSVSQRDADVFHFWHKFQNAPEGSLKKLKAQKQYLDAMAHRKHIDHSMQLIGQHLFGSDKVQEVMNAVRPAGRPLVDDWSCLKTMVETFEMHCGSLSQYGKKYMRSLANICNAGIQKEMMADASAEACRTVTSGSQSSRREGFGA